MKVLITRYGGIGDVAPVSAMAKQLHKRGHEVTLALRDDGPVTQTDLLRNQKWCKLLDYKQVGPWGTRCVKYEHGLIQIEALFDDYDEVIDMMYVTEGNSTCKSSFMDKPSDCWKMSRNSNWINWYDNHLMWANIDPSTVPDDEKRPEFSISKKEAELAKKIRKGYSHVFCMNPVASSLARTWYQAKDLLPMLVKHYDNPLLILWNPKEGAWTFQNRLGDEDRSITLSRDVKSSLRQSMAILKASDLYVGVDTGLSHIAEGLGVPHIAIYSTVPAWTRNKYYKYQTAIDPGVDHPEFYTFALRAGDPLNAEEGLENLTEREKKLKKLYEDKPGIDVVCRELNTDAPGADMELKALHAKMSSFERMQSKALSTVTPEMVLEKVRELCK